MMKMTGKAFAKKLFGAKYERLPRTLFMDVIVFWGLYIAGFQVQIASFVRVLMISAFTAGVMWQALSSKDNVVELTAMLMLPHRRREFVFSYVGMLGAYTVLTKTGLLFAVLLAVSAWKPVEIVGMILCMIHAVFMAAAVYSVRKYWYVGGLWAAAIVSAILFFGNELLVGLLLLVNGLFAVLILWRTDGYDFYQKESKKSHGKAYHVVRQRKRATLWRYFFRYLSCHKNYLLNTVVMWCVALVLPYFFSEMAGLSVIPVGFAILSLNTPICILLSCDPDLEQAVRFLPGQKRRFCIPYCLFIFLCNMAADVIFLCSWQIQNGSVTVHMIAGAVFFALQSAVLSVLLEWFYPIRGWKIESDLWHHPRKYVVPVVMLLLAGGVLAWPILLYALLVLLAVEIIVLFFIL
ncbi:hypothetical protein [Parablautia intestinalis]|uniref:hypothetical protein n=1 Tax=Parablautia intestinalis TaxID=2320100 RepID=UPI00256F3538|nr:hypothetical protein [Parablautia intestinalis]